jgi:hypothetical protein
VKAYAPNSALDIRQRTASMRWMTRWPFSQMIAKQFDKAGDVLLAGYDLAALAYPTRRSAHAAGLCDDRASCPR